MKGEGRLRSALRFAMGLLFSLALGCLLLLPLHQRFAYSLALPSASAPDRFELMLPDGAQLAVGDEASLHRYVPDLRSELGRARVIERVGDRVRFEVDSGTLLFPLGRRGSITKQREGRVLVDLGRAEGPRRGDRLIVFREGRPVGSLKLLDDAARESGLWRAVLEPPLDDAIGLMVSEYTVQTRVSFIAAPGWWVALELALFAGLALAELLLFRRGRSGLVALVGGSVRAAWRSRSERTRARIATLAAWLLAPGLCYLGSALVSAAVLRLAPPPIATAMAGGGRWALLGFLLLAYALAWGPSRGAPLAQLWQSLAYQPRKLLRRVSDDPGLARFAAWALQLVIAYAFAFSLIDFLSANLNAIFEHLAIDDAKLQLQRARLSAPSSIPAWLQACATNLSLLARDGIAALTLDQWLGVARLTLWSLTIVGALVGYLHSVLRIFPWSAIRNVDFTLLGWGTNAICYGPLLGAWLWSSVPAADGAWPVAIAGPLFYVLIFVELGFNALYTASVWNMGTKFGVMVDKGIVDRGFFAVIRHPNYTLEACMFFLICARGLSAPENWLGASFYLLTYWLRAEREEVFLGASNPGYADYRERVRWKYVPGLI